MGIYNFEEIFSKILVVIYSVLHFDSLNAWKFHMPFLLSADFFKRFLHTYHQSVKQ